jgi:hypothetical protein
MHPDLTGICPRKKHVSDYKTLISDSGAFIRKVAITFSRRAYSNRWASAIFSGCHWTAPKDPCTPKLLPMPGTRKPPAIFFLSRVDRFLPIFRLRFVFSVSAWFPGGATIFQPCIRWPRPLSEPDLRISRIRLFKQVHSLSADSRFGFGDNVITRALCPASFPCLDTPACQPLSSTDIIRLQRYYELIRLPAPHPQSLVSSAMSTP